MDPLKQARTVAEVGPADVKWLRKTRWPVCGKEWLQGNRIHKVVILFWVILTT
jgi:hypothetical protein